jgi:FHS family L-fucose permease-like MFS transporter
VQNAQRGSLTAAYIVVTCLFFAWGFITSLVDPLVAAVKGIFTLTDVQAQLSASAFFIAYGVMSFPAALLLSRMRAVPTVLIALVLMLVGCLLMLLAANIAVYEVVLLGLFVLASGITILQVAANPLAAALGPPERSHFRLTFSQTFNSFGTFIGPFLGSVLFLRGLEVKEGSAVTEAARSASLAGIDRAFFWIAGLILLVAVLIWSGRRIIRAAAPAPPSETAKVGMIATFTDALSSPWARFGGLAIFLYVGAEVAIGTQMALFLNSKGVWDIALQDAGKMVSLYWGGAMVGRLVGSALLTRFRPAILLAVFTGMACAMCLYVFGIGGVTAGYVALAIGLFNSLMFPVIFTLTLERSTASDEATSGFLCFSIVGGAAIPPLVGLVSQHSDYATSFIVPAACYAILLAFSLAAHRSPVRLRDQPAVATIH